MSGPRNMPTFASSGRRTKARDRKLLASAKTFHELHIWTHPSSGYRSPTTVLVIPTLLLIAPPSILQTAAARRFCEMPYPMHDTPAQYQRSVCEVSKPRLPEQNSPIVKTVLLPKFCESATFPQNTPVKIWSTVFDATRKPA